jgi:hypothetical protein
MVDMSKYKVGDKVLMKMVVDEISKYSFRGVMI